MNFKAFFEATTNTATTNPAVPSARPLPVGPQSQPQVRKSGLSDQDFTHLNQQDRMKQGRDIGEAFIIQQLKRHGVNISPTQSKAADMHDKIDGYLDGKQTEPVQIKLRRSGAAGRDDIAYEVARCHADKVPLADLLKDERNQGRDFKGVKAKHYFMMDKAETKICHIPAAILKMYVMRAIAELNTSRSAGRLERAFRASNGVELRPTQDRDPSSYTPYKIMAFVPTDKVTLQTYPIT